MLSHAAAALGGQLLPAAATAAAARLLPAAAAASARLLGGARGAAWSVEREPATYKSVDDIIQDSVIVRHLEATKEAAKDPACVRDILAAAKDRSFLTNHKPGEQGGPGGAAQGRPMVCNKPLGRGRQRAASRHGHPGRACCHPCTAIAQPPLPPAKLPLGPHCASQQAHALPHRTHRPSAPLPSLTPVLRPLPSRALGVCPGPDV